MCVAYVEKDDEIIDDPIRYSKRLKLCKLDLFILKNSSVLGL